jgi:2-methylfumaryl-CoA isomerase
VKGILSGMRVVEASAFVAAPSGGMTLAQMGADVIRIDNIGGGLDYHRWPVIEDNTSLFWAGLNKSKRSVAINFRSPEGAELAKQIITAPGKEAGMLLTNFPPKGWLSFDELKKFREDLIQLTVMGDREGGSAVDYTVNPAIGLPFLTGSAESLEPTNHVLPAWDLITGQMAALGLLAAERHRYRTGEGQHVKLALEDVALAAMGNLGFIAEAQLGVKRERYGNYLFGAFGRDFLTRDGKRVMVIGLTSRQWKALCQATGLSAELDKLSEKLGLDFSWEGHRFKARDSISELIGGWILAHRYAEVKSLFDEQGVCWSKYNTVSEMVEEHPHRPAINPIFNEIDQPGIGPYLAASAPWDFTAYEPLPARPAPKLGQHTDEVLADVVGLDSAQIGQLHDKGIVAGAD